MKRNNYRTSNRKFAYLMTVVIVIVNFITIIIPLFFLYTFPTSKLTFIFFTYPNNLISIFGVLFFIYFAITGIFYFTFKADRYIIEVRSKRIILGYLLNKVDYIDIPVGSIVRFTFFNRPLTFNTTLMVKVKVSSRRTVSKRFQISFLSKKKIAKITESLEEIVRNNNLDE